MFKKCFLSVFFAVQAFALFGDNQTDTISPVLPQDGSDLPFDVSIELAPFQLPNGWQGGAIGQWKNKALFIAGRTNGLHGFSNDPNVNNFPPSAQNLMIFVVDFEKEKVWQRSLTDPASGLTQEQVDTLSVTASQYYQRKRTLYITGGYGINTFTGLMETKSTLTAINVPKLMRWVMEPDRPGTASEHIRQTSNPLLQVTGGYMNKFGKHKPTLLIFGQNFTGLYNDSSNGAYTQQVRKFHIVDNELELRIIPSKHQSAQDPNYRRRDLSVIPVLLPTRERPKHAYVAFSGVFTLTSGIWTVPVIIYPDGSSEMADPQNPDTFKQGMSNYNCPVAGLYSKELNEMYAIFFGGMTFEFFQNGSFQTDSEIPFTNQITTIKIDRKGNFSQYLMNNQYPTISSTFSNPGNTLLFGASTHFVLAHNLQQYSNRVLALDRLPRKPTVIGYIVGGIQSTLPNTNFNTDSAASPYIFEVVITPKGEFKPVSG